jgi:hypothetical protein
MTKVPTGRKQQGHEERKDIWGRDGRGQEEIHRRADEEAAAKMVSPPSWPSEKEGPVVRCGSCPCSGEPHRRRTNHLPISADPQQRRRKTGTGGCWVRLGLRSREKHQHCYMEHTPFMQCIYLMSHGSRFMNKTNYCQNAPLVYSLSIF